jgi:hypothetical protein
MSIPIAGFFGNTDPLKRIHIEKNDSLFITEVSCKFCYHRRKSPVIISFCEKQSFFWRLIDLFIQISFNSRYYKENCFIRYITSRAYSFQNRERNGKNIALCMKNIESQKVSKQLAEWFEKIGIE